jgi:hypothetical protein
MRLLGSSSLFFHSSVRFPVRPCRKTQFSLHSLLWNFKLRSYWQFTEKIKLYWKSNKDNRMSPVDLRMFVSTLFISITMANFAPKLPTLNSLIAILVPCLTWLPCFFLWLDSPSGPRLPHFPDFNITDSPHSVGLPWTSPSQETSTWQHSILKRHTHPCPRRDSSPQFRTHDLDRAATEIGYLGFHSCKCSYVYSCYID